MASLRQLCTSVSGIADSYNLVRRRAYRNEIKERCMCIVRKNQPWIVDYFHRRM